MKILRDLFRAAVVILAVTAIQADAAERLPLLVEGKTTIFQRVLSRPGAVTYSGPERASETGRLRPFQPLYVYTRQGNWVEYGRGQATGPEGWVEAADVVEWRQNIVVAFSNPAGRTRQLLFETEDALMRLLNHQSGLSLARRYREEAVAGESSEASGVISIEPEDYVDIMRNFYLLPILDWRQEEHPMSFERMLLLKLASLPLQDDSTPPEGIDLAKDYKIGLVFVIDTTSSMEPFIEETRAAVKDILKRVRNSPQGGRVRFGVIGFRDSIQAAPGIRYTTKVFVPLSMQQTEEEVLAGLAELSDAGGLTYGFDEDSVAGVIEAVDLAGWGSGQPGDPNSFGGRFILVVSDASPKRPSDPNARFDLDPGSVKLRAQERNIQIMAMHLLTPDGLPNHAAAERAYREMTVIGVDGSSLYYPISGGEPAAFAAQVNEIVEFFVSEIDTDLAELRRRAEDPDQELTPLQEASLAMRLAYLGRSRATTVPSVFESWTLDRSIENPAIPALDVRLLVTKNQLSTMRDIMAEIVEAGETTQGNLRSGNFFEMLQGAIARMAQDPESIVNTQFETLGDAVGEFLSDLPYHSVLMDVTAEEWENMGPRRRTILDRVRARLTLYEQFHDNPRMWVALYEGAPPGEHVIAMPLEALP